ncbi:cytochrome P450 [Rhizoctonia solani]|nr:cytochrome P450 [Rhizoctonia solani]
MDRLYGYIPAAGLCAALIWAHSKQAKSHGPLPPSPEPDPLIGNLRAMMSIPDETRAYRDWGRELGSDIISITIPGQVIIVLNSQEAAEELLSKRSSIYSDRPKIPMICSDRLTGWGNYTCIIGYGEEWRFHRKLMHEVLNKNASEERWPLIERDSRLALKRILANSAEFTQELRRMAGSNLLASVYGYEVTSQNDGLVDTVVAAVKGFNQADVIGFLGFLVNTFPWLEYVPEWFPGATWKAKANAWRHQKEEMLHIPYEWTKSKMSAGIEVPSMLSTWLKKYMHQETTVPIDDLEEHIRWIAGGMFAAGSDTSVTVLRALIIAMAMHPEIQAKAQAEIDSVIGLRLPELADQDSLPYVQCIIKEVTRWRVPAPMGMGHSCIQDDTYKGYHIPKGAILLTRAINNNPDVYPEPDRFDPDRFLDPSVPGAPIFGFGRRICPGLHHAEAVIFITVAGLLAMFDIQPEEDANGNPIPLKADTTLNEILQQVLPFQCRIIPRSSKHAQIVRGIGA